MYRILPESHTESRGLEKKYISRNYRYVNSEKNLQTDYELLAIRRQVYVGGERGSEKPKKIMMNNLMNNLTIMPAAAPSAARRGALV
jgi:hypothetical protein